MPRDADGLTPRAARFVVLVVTQPDTPHSQLYRQAGFVARTENSAMACASRLLSDAKVRAAIECKQALIGATADVNPAKVLRRLCEIADLDLADVIAEDGTLLDVHGMQEKVRKSLAGIETEERTFGEGESAVSTTVRKVKLSDRLKALELIGKHLGMFTERVQLTGADGGPVRIVEIVRAVGPGELAGLPTGDGETLGAGAVRELGAGEMVKRG